MKYTVAFLLFTACASPSTKASPKTFLDGVAPAQTTADTIVDSLKRGDKQTGFYWIEVYPDTDPLVEAQARETATRRKDNEQAIQKYIDDRKALMTKDKTCFEFDLSTVAAQAALFKFYTAKLTSADQSYPLIFSSVSSEPIPGSPLRRWKWHNKNQACADHKIDLTKEFKVLFVSDIEKESKPSELTWKIAPPQAIVTHPNSIQPAAAQLNKSSPLGY